MHFPIRAQGNREENISSNTADKDREGRDAALRQVAQNLASADNLSDVLRRVAELAFTGTRAKAVHLERVDFAAEEVEVIASVGDATPAIGGRVPFPGSLAEEVLTRRQPEVLERGELANRPIAGLLVNECHQCRALVVPMISEEEAVGAMIIFRLRDQETFSEEEIARMLLLGNLAALGLRRALVQAKLDESVARLRESKQLFELLVQGVRDYAIFMMDPEGRIVSWNQGAAAIKGYTESEIVGQHFSIFYTDEDRNRNHPENELRLARQNGSYREEGWRVRKDGSRFWGHVTITAVHDESAHLVGFSKVTRDLTERRKAEEQRDLLLERERTARIEAERASQAKSQFLTTMSHELRTPMNAVMGYADLLNAEIAGPLNPTQREFLDRIEASSKHLLSLIGDVLDMAKIEAGRVEVNVSPVDPVRAVAAAIQLITPLASAKGLSIQNACRDTDDVLVYADAGRLHQILVNLLSNAVKFNRPGGRITVSCGRVEARVPGGSDADRGPWVRLRVEDTGIGIAAEQLEKIWSPFFQVDSGHTRSTEGSGLGLSISRSLARLMGGDLLGQSEPGTGSTFLLFLPAAEPNAREAPSPDGERRGKERHSPGISIVKTAVLLEIEQIVGSYLGRLRVDPLLPKAWQMGDAELEDHAATLLVDIAEAVGAVEEAAGGASPILRDSQAIQRTLAERHGERREKAGWGADELRRDYQILREELEAAVKRRLERELREESAPAVHHGLNLFSQFLERAQLISLERLRS